MLQKDENQKGNEKRKKKQKPNRTYNIKLNDNIKGETSKPRR